MKSNISENVILFDWLTCTCQSDDPELWKEILGMTGCAWEPLEKGRNGYKRGYYFGSIWILYDGAENMGVCLEMSGLGCRSFEEHGTGDFISLFALIGSSEAYHISRLDVAFDDHTGILDIEQLFNDSEDKLYISRSRTLRLEKEYKDNRCGITVYHGSKKSDVLIRIYDKAVERGAEDQHWIRVELQLRNDRAAEFINQSAPVGEVFAGVLHNYLRYVVEDPLDQNRSRWPMQPYWEQLINGAHKIKLFITPGLEYNVAKLDHFSFEMAGPALKCCMDLYGVSFVVGRILDIDIQDNLKYQKLLRQYGKKNNAQRRLLSEEGGFAE